MGLLIICLPCFSSLYVSSLFLPFVLCFFYLPLLLTVSSNYNPCLSALSLLSKSPFPGPFCLPILSSLLPPSYLSALSCSTPCLSALYFLSKVPPLASLVSLPCPPSHSWPTLYLCLVPPLKKSLLLVLFIITLSSISSLPS